MRAADRVRLGTHQRLNKRLQMRTQQIRLGTLKVLLEHLGKVNTVGVGGHRDDLLQNDLAVF
jgi:hypothetical protein